jgi:hypothetical protein
MDDIRREYMPGYEQDHLQADNAHTVALIASTEEHLWSVHEEMVQSCRPGTRQDFA